MQQQIQEIQSKLSKKLSEKRFTHTIGVLYTAEALAMRYGEDLDKAAYASVLHDCAKYCSGEQMLQKCRKYNIEIYAPSDSFGNSKNHIKLYVNI